MCTCRLRIHGGLGGRLGSARTDWWKEAYLNTDWSKEAYVIIHPCCGGNMISAQVANGCGTAVWPTRKNVCLSASISRPLQTLAPQSQSTNLMKQPRLAHARSVIAPLFGQLRRRTFLWVHPSADLFREETGPAELIDKLEEEV